MIKAIEDQVSRRSEFDEAVKPENQKLFPFFVFTNFDTNKNYPKVCEPLHCSYCNEPLKDGYGYYTAFIVFESKDDVRVCCSLRECRPQPKPYDYQQQIHGYPNPIVLIDEFQDSIKHLVVARCFIGSSTSYALNRYLKTGITWEQLKAVSYLSSYQGGSHVYGKFGAIYCSWTWNGTYLTTSEGEIIKLSKSQIVDIVNEILEANRVDAHKQLSLF